MLRRRIPVRLVIEQHPCVPVKERDVNDALHNGRPVLCNLHGKFPFPVYFRAGQHAPAEITLEERRGSLKPDPFRFLTRHDALTLHALRFIPHRGIAPGRRIPEGVQVNQSQETVGGGTDIHRQHFFTFHECRPGGCLTETVGMQFNFILPLVLNRLLFLRDRPGRHDFTLPDKTGDTGFYRYILCALRLEHSVRPLRCREHALNLLIRILLQLVTVFNGLRIHHGNTPVSVHSAPARVRNHRLPKDSRHDHVQHGPCLPDARRFQLVQPHFFVPGPDAAHKTQALHGAGHGHIQQARVLRNAHALFPDTECFLSVGIHDAVRPPADHRKIQPQCGILSS